MANIVDTVDKLSNERSTNISLFASVGELEVAPLSIKGSKHFRKVSVDLTKIPAMCAGTHGGPIVVDLNVTKLRKRNSGFIPKILLLSGLDTLKASKAKHSMFAEAWVGTKVLAKYHGLMSPDISRMYAGMSNSDLSDKLRVLISDAYSKKTQKQYPYNDSTYAYVSDIYPYDNYCIFSQGKDKYKQLFKIDNTTQEVALSGKPIRVVETYVEVTPTVVTANSEEDVLVNYGAKQSDLNTMLYVEEALRMYRYDVNRGTWTRRVSVTDAVSPILANSIKEATIAANAINLKNFVPLDFMLWQHKQLEQDRPVKAFRGNSLSAMDFAYVGDKKDPSTWFLPKNTPSNAKQSLTALHNVTELPKGERRSVQIALQSAAQIKPVSIDALIAKLDRTLSAGGPGSGRHKGRI